MTKKQKIIIGVAVIILGTLTSASLLLAMRVWDPSWNPYRPSAEQIVYQAFQAARNAQTAKVNANVQLDFHKEQQRVFGVQANMEAETDYGNPEAQRSQGTIDGTASFEGVQISFAADYKLVDENWYMRITTFPFLSYLEAFTGGSLEGLKNQWIVIENDELSSELSQTQARNEELQEKIADKYRELFESNRLFRDIELLPDQTIEGKTYYHIRLVFNTQALQEVYALVAEESSQEENLLPATAGAYGTPELLTEDFLEEFFGETEGIPMEVWVDKQEMITRRVLVRTELEPEAFPGFGASVDSMTARLQLDVLDINSPVSVQAPENAKKLEEIIGQIGESSPALQGAPSDARDARRQSDIRQIATAMEIYYNLYNRYPSSTTLPTSIEGDITQGIGSVMPSVPGDPGGGVCADYQWISNISNPQSYCVYACLENGQFFVSSPRGAFELPIPPGDLQACES